MFVLIGAVTWSLSVTSNSRARAAQFKDSATSCVALKSADFSRLLDAPTQIMDSVLVAAAGNLPVYCKVTGYVAPSVGFLLALPADDWNGKFLEQGCGGFCGGSLAQAVEQHGEFLLGDPLRRGYASLIFDGGHASGGYSALWAYNNLQAQFDFGIRAPHVAALAGKAITEHFYTAAPAKSYFTGCSSGGQQALSEAQRFPWDFDGIISGAPSPTFSGPMMYYLWAARALNGTVDRADLKVVRERAVAQCDMDDGVKDDVIGDPLHCQFDPAELLCKSDQKAACLTPAQVDAVKKVYSGPMTSTGEKIYTGGPLPGSELNWITDQLSGAYLSAGVAEPWPEEYFSYVGFMPAPGPSWTPADFDFDRDYKRLRMAESLFGAADNPDLRKFKAAGGKLLMYQGGQDQSDIPADAIDYYETVEKTLGGRAVTQDFFRLFLVPGMNHCSGGAGAFAIDYLSHLEAWVEKGEVPDKMIGAHLEGDKSFSKKAKFTRPIFPYPVRAKYKGSGDPNDAENFIPVEQ